MRNYFGGLHQFPTNITGRYRIAVLADVVLSGQNNYLSQVDYFLGVASHRDISDALYLGPSLSPVEVDSWPQKPNLTTWCLHPPSTLAAPPLAGSNVPGNGRDDLRVAPVGFVIARPGYMMPLFLHHYGHLPATFAKRTADAAVHLIGGLPHRGDRELPNGGYEISIGTFPFAAAIVELELSESGELVCSVLYWQLDTSPPGEWA